MLNSDPKEKLPSIKNTLTEAIALYRGRFRDFSLVMGFQSVVSLAYYYIVFIINPGYWWLQSLAGLFFVGIGIVTAIIQIYLVSDKKITIRQSLVKTKGKIIGAFWIYFLVFIIIFGGAYLFLIPLAIFSTWFAFSRYIFLFESESGMDAILKSREYVRGYFWPIFVRLLISVVFSIVFYLVPSFTFLKALPKPFLYFWSTFWAFFATPVFLIYWLVIYRQLVSIKNLGVFKATNGKKALYLGFGLLSIVVFFLLAFLIIVIFAMAYVAKNPSSFVNNPL